MGPGLSPPCSWSWAFSGLSWRAWGLICSIWKGSEACDAAATPAPSVSGSKSTAPPSTSRQAPASMPFSESVWEGLSLLFGVRPDEPGFTSCTQGAGDKGQGWGSRGAAGTVTAFPATAPGSGMDGLNSGMPLCDAAVSPRGRCEENKNSVADNEQRRTEGSAGNGRG